MSLLATLASSLGLANAKHSLKELWTEVHIGCYFQYRRYGAKISAKLAMQV